MKTAALFLRCFILHFMCNVKCLENISSYTLDYHAVVTFVVGLALSAKVVLSAKSAKIGIHSATGCCNTIFIIYYFSNSFSFN
jgi:hypothetical protein